MDQRPRYFFSQIYFFRTIDDLLLLQKGGHKMLDFYYIQISCFSLLYMHANFILWTKNNPSDEITALFTFNICFIKIYFWTPKCQGWNCRMLDRFSLLLFQCTELNLSYDSFVYRLPYSSHVLFFVVELVTSIIVCIYSWKIFTLEFEKTLLLQ